MSVDTIVSFNEMMVSMILSVRRSYAVDRRREGGWDLAWDLEGDLAVVLVVDLAGGLEGDLEWYLEWSDVPEEALCLYMTEWMG